MNSAPTAAEILGANSRLHVLAQLVPVEHSWPGLERLLGWASTTSDLWIENRAPKDPVIEGAIDLLGYPRESVFAAIGAMVATVAFRAATEILEGEHTRRLRETIARAPADVSAAIPSGEELLAALRAEPTLDLVRVAFDRGTRVLEIEEFERRDPKHPLLAKLRLGLLNAELLAWLDRGHFHGDPQEALAVAQAIADGRNPYEPAAVGG